MGKQSHLSDIFLITALDIVFSSTYDGNIRQPVKIFEVSWFIVKAEIDLWCTMLFIYRL